MEDYLEVWQGIVGIGSWSRKFFILNENVLTYCSEKGGDTEGKVHLQIAQVVDDNPSKPTFELNNGMEVMKIRAESVDKKSRWISALLDN